MRNDIITIGGATEDITFHTDEGVVIDNKRDIVRQKLLAFEYGAKIRINEATYTYGGGAANAAVSLARLGFRVSALCAIGSDERGKRVVDNLQRHGVHTKLIQRIARAETGFTFILIGPGKEHVAFLHRGANEELHISSHENAGLSKARWAYLSSLSGRNWEQVLKKIFSHERLLIAWNPGVLQISAGSQALKRYLAKTTVLLLNKDEAVELVFSDPSYRRKKHKFFESAENLCRAIHGFGPTAVVVTEGEEGATAFDGEYLYRQGPVKAKKVVDTTGVGDAFGSSFIAGLDLFEADIEKALALAARNAASVVTELGAQNGLLTKNAIGRSF